MGGGAVAEPSVVVPPPLLIGTTVRVQTKGMYAASEGLCPGESFVRPGWCLHLDGSVPVGGRAVTQLSIEVESLSVEVPIRAQSKGGMGTCADLFSLESCGSPVWCVHLDGLASCGGGAVAEFTVFVGSP